MSAPLAVLPLPRPKTPDQYDQRTQEQSFQSVERELEEKYDRRGDLILPRGMNLVVSADDGSAQYGLGVNADGLFRILDYSDGSIGTFSVSWAQVDGAAQEITNLTAYVDTADATLQGGITTNASSIVTNGTAISTIETEITAARDGETNLSAKITSVETAFVSADTAIASDVSTLSAEVTNARDGETNLSAKITSVEAAFASADTAIAGDVTTLTARVTTNEGDITTAQADIVTANTAIADETSARATAIQTVTAQIRGGSNLLSLARFDDVAAAGSANVDPVGWNNRPDNAGMTGADAGVTGSSVGASNQPPGLRCLRFRQPSSQTSGYSDAIYEGRNADYMDISCIPGARYCASVYANAQNSSEMRVILNFRDSSGTFISAGDNVDNDGYSTTAALGVADSLADMDRIFSFADAPSNAAFVTMNIQKYPDDGGLESFGFAALPQIEEATADQENPSPWSEAARNAEVSVNATAIAGIDGNLTAAYGVTVDANNRIAALRLLSDGTTATAELLADKIYFGDNTTFEDTYNSFYTEDGTYRNRFGGPFPASGDLVEWFGLESVALNSETKTNGIWAKGTDGKMYYGSSELNAAVNFTASYSGAWSNTGGTSANFTASRSVNTTGLAGAKTYYTQIIDSTSLVPKCTITSPASVSPTLQATGFSVSETETGTIQTTVTDTTTGQTTTVQAAYTMTRTS